MGSIEDLRRFFGWCTVINFGLLMLSTVAVVAMGDWMSELHGSMFGVEQDEILESYFSYVATFKIFVLVFSLTPYLSLRLMGR